MGIFEDRPKSLEELLEDPLEKLARERAEERLGRPGGIVIGGSAGYERMRAGEISPEEAASHVRAESLATAQEEIARIRKPYISLGRRALSFILRK